MFKYACIQYGSNYKCLAMMSGDDATAIVVIFTGPQTLGAKRPGNGWVRLHSTLKSWVISFGMYSRTLSRHAMDIARPGLAVC